MKKALLAVGGFALVITVSACARPVSGHASPTDTVFGNAQELVRAATAKADQATSTRFMLTETIGRVGTIVVHGESRFGADAATDMTINVLGGLENMEIEMRFVDQTVYVKVPPEASAMTGGKPWGRVTDENQLAMAMGDITDMAEQNDPTKALDQIQQGGTITKIEQTTLDGQPVSHYWVDIDFAKVAASFADSSGVPVEELQKLADGPFGTTLTIPTELWLNQDSLLVQITEDLTPLIKATDAPEDVLPVNVILKYSNWGAPVDIQAPPADQVGEFTLRAH